MNRMTCKSVETVTVTPEQMNKINTYTRRALTAEEVFVFTVVLCDNEVDRDNERFSIASLEKLGKLFLGMTGVFDHAPTAENQAARIFDTALEQKEELNSVGEPYTQLKAWAYMVRCEKNADLILEIDAGIKKEISVSCAVDEVRCSICGADQKTVGCAHRKGEIYDGRMCHHLLINPTDAYEWSFVAVPAQKRAGVVKRRGASVDGVTIPEVRLKKLQRLAALGAQYENSLRREVVKYGLLGHRELNEETLKSMTDKLNAHELEALKKTFVTDACKVYPLAMARPQLAHQDSTDNDNDNDFRI